MNEVGELLPVAAWIQAVFVCLFFLIVAYMLWWNGKQSKEGRDFQKSESDSNRAFQENESNKWQKFIYDLNSSWQNQNTEQRQDNNCAMADVNKSITNLATVTQGLVSEVREMRVESRQIAVDLHNHDLQAKEIMAIVKPQPKPRAKKVEQP